LEGPRVGCMPNRGQSPSSFSALKPLKSVPSGQSRHVSPAVVAAFYSSTNAGNISHTAQPISANLSPDTNPPPGGSQEQPPRGPVGRVPSDFGDHGDHLVPSNVCNWPSIQHSPDLPAEFKGRRKEDYGRKGTGETWAKQQRDHRKFITLSSSATQS